MTTEVATAVRSTEEHRILTLRRELEQRSEEFRMVLPSHITPEKLQRTVLTAVQLNPDLLACDRRSFLTACMKSAQDGLLPDGREAAIVPFKSRTKDPQRGWVEIRLAQYMPMVWGLRKKMLQSGEIRDIFAAVVYRQEIERECFHYEEGSERALRHRPILDPDFAPTDADIALAYSVATFADGSKSFEVMRRGEIDRVREASQTGARFDAKGEPRDPKGPWRDWYSEMAKKTVLRRHSKSLPQSGDIILTDVEAVDMGLGAARSAVALLDSHKPEPPRSLGGPGGDPFDPETGEVLEPELNPPAPEPERPAEPPTVEEPEPLAEAPEPAPIPPLDDEPSHPETDALQPFDVGATAEPKSLETDEYGITKDDAERRAESYIARARKAELLIDLRTLEREAELDLAAMPPEIASVVDLEFTNARKRLQQKGKGD